MRTMHIELPVTLKIFMQAVVKLLQTQYNNVWIDNPFLNNSFVYQYGFCYELGMESYSI